MQEGLDLLSCVLHLRKKNRVDYKPNSVPAEAGHDHLTGMPVARHLVQPTRKLWTEPPSNVSLFGLAPGGVYPALYVTIKAVSSYLTISTLPVNGCPFHRRCLFCGTFLRFPKVPVKNHRALRCSDFPHRHKAGATMRPP